MMLKRFYEDYHGMNGMMRKLFRTQVTTNQRTNGTIATNNAFLFPIS